MKILSTLTIVILFASCGTEDSYENRPRIAPCINYSAIEEPESDSDPINLSFLCDLSSRIDPNLYPNMAMSYADRDSAMIMEIVRAFTVHLRSQNLRALDDHVQIFFEEEPQDERINSITNELRFHFTRNNTDSSLINQMGCRYIELIPEVYETVIEDSGSIEKNYKGADLWTFFKNNAEKYCMKPDHRNILVVLTDGYLFHEDNVSSGNRVRQLLPSTTKKLRLTDNQWRQKFTENDYGFDVPDVNLASLEIILVGLNPSTKSKNIYEEDVMQAFWEKWFLEMGVKQDNILIRKSDLPTNVRDLLHGFILKK